MKAFNPPMPLLNMLTEAEPAALVARAKERRKLARSVPALVVVLALAANLLKLHYAPGSSTPAKFEFFFSINYTPQFKV
jgi:hypothetical protein